MPVKRCPAIVVLLTDQHRWDALGCVTPLVRTPVLDGLAKRGVRYAQAVCHAPMCMPARHALMLGLHASQSGFRHNTNMAPTDADLPLPVLPQRLLDLGYQTAGFGNAHWWEQDLFYRRPVPVMKTTRGFEVRVTAQADEDEPGALRKLDSIPG